MLHRVLIGLAGLSLTVVAVHAAPKPDSRAAIAKAIQNSMDGDPEPMSVSRLKSAMKRVDIDGDAIPDWQVNWEKYGSASWCGTGGCRYQLWRGVAGGDPVIVFERQVREVKTRKTALGTVFDFDFHGSVCGGFGVEECPASYGWDSKLGRMVERVAANGDGTIRLLSPYENFEEDVPYAVEARIVARKGQCAAMGAGVGEYGDEYFLPVSVPDVDGDGARDWLLNGSTCVYTDDRDSVDLPDELMVTAGDAAKPALALTAKIIRLSVSTTPASVMTVERVGECETYSTQPDATLCPATPMRWDAAAKMFAAR
jgi:hypothetical protein